MSYIVAEVHEWHRIAQGTRKHPIRRWAKSTTLHSRHTDLKEAQSVRSSLNSGHKQQRYWVLDEKGKVV